MPTPPTDLSDVSELSERLLQHLAQSPAVLVTVARTQGSVPRELGTWMGVFADRVVSTRPWLRRASCCLTPSGPPARSVGHWARPWASAAAVW